MRPPRSGSTVDERPNRYLPTLDYCSIAAISSSVGGREDAARSDTAISLQRAAADAGLPAAILFEVGGVLLLVGISRPRRRACMTLFTVATAVIFHHDFADQNTIFHS